MRFTTLLSCLAGMLSPIPDAATRARLDALRAPPPRGTNLEAREREYQALLHPFTALHVGRIYAEAERSRARVFYAAFVPAGAPPGKDLGFGLHVVRRWVLATALGPRIVEVNEQWEEDPVTGGLFPPDGVRTKVRFEGDERTFFDLLRVGWDADGLPTLWRTTRFRWQSAAESNRRVPMRIPVSAPLSCVGCHHARNPFAAEFTRPGETTTPDAIVQPARFDEPLAESPGYREYFAHRTRRGNDPARVALARAALDGGLWNGWTGRLGDALAAGASVELRWLPEDPAAAGVVGRWTYRRRGGTYVDALAAQDANERLAVP